MKSNNKCKAQSAFRNLGAVALITATIFFVACNKTGGGKQKAPFVEGGASLILSPDNLTIKVRAKTADDSDIAVEGCNETTLKNNQYAELHAKGTKVILKGKITELNCGWNYLVAVNVQGLTTLKELGCSGNQLPELNVQGLTALRTLDCSNNQLTALNVQGLTNLQKLDCSDNQLTALNVQGLTALKELTCYINKLTELNVQGLTALQKLDCPFNKLTALNVQGLTALQKLYCSENQLTALNVQGLTALQELYCSYNQLTALNVQGRTALKYLWCYSNQLNAQAITELLKALPARKASDDTWAVLYTEETDVSEGNCKDFSQPAELKTAFDGAKKRNWTLQKRNASGKDVDI